MEILEFIFRDFWTFIGFWIITLIPFTFVQQALTTITRYKNIKAHGWPPNQETENREDSDE